MDPDELLTVQEAAALLKVAPSWIYERTRLRKMPMRKLGGHVRIPKAELLRWIDTQDELAATEVG
ncbi:MAG: helix-turn-helix domain-containing protein [Candidatus Latescibacterota bacterium]|jgi:excisionase family DNA binding protein|tara:strand:+ start:622 stop:816 length:195 start_codon:yes stop_codon:yes gene_type:complete